MLTAFPCTLGAANGLVAIWHRHHDPVIGHRFSIGCACGAGQPRGVVIVGRPVSRKTNQYDVAEISRLVTDGSRNACSFLYGRASQAAKAMGFKKIQTFTLPEEGGASLRAAGFVFVGETRGGDWNQPSRKGRKTTQPQQPKWKWEKVLNI